MKNSPQTQPGSKICSGFSPSSPTFFCQSRTLKQTASLALRRHSRREWILGLLYPLVAISGLLAGNIAHADIRDDLMHSVVHKYKQTTAQETIKVGVGPMTLDIDNTTETSVKTVTGTESSGSTESSQKFRLESTASFSYGSGSGTAGVSQEFESAIKSYYKNSREVTTTNSNRNNKKEHYDYAKGEPYFFGRTTISAGPFSTSYETNIQLPPSSPRDVTITVSTDLSPIFNSLMKECARVSTMTNADAGMWSTYRGMCNTGRTQGIRAYLTEARGIAPASDNGSWEQVKAAAAKAEVALNKGNKLEAVQTLALAYGFFQQSSHNGGLWEMLNTEGERLLSGLPQTAY